MVSDIGAELSTLMLGVVLLRLGLISRSTYCRLYDAHVARKSLASRRARR